MNKMLDADRVLAVIKAERELLARRIEGHPAGTDWYRLSDQALVNVEHAIWTLIRGPWGQP